uniref:Secreted protein n=1 Tax=Romanomermis culicivorax TaxID=13658 RepID=A0A915IVX5_ROMCU
MLAVTINKVFVDVVLLITRNFLHHFATVTVGAVDGWHGIIPVVAEHSGQHTVRIACQSLSTRSVFSSTYVQLDDLTHVGHILAFKNWSKKYGKLDLAIELLAVVDQGLLGRKKTQGKLSN